MHIRLALHGLNFIRIWSVYGGTERITKITIEVYDGICRLAYILLTCRKKTVHNNHDHVVFVIWGIYHSFDIIFLFLSISMSHMEIDINNWITVPSDSVSILKRIRRREYYRNILLFIISDPAWEHQHFGFWSGLTQTRLYSYWRWLEAWNFVFRK